MAGDWTPLRDNIHDDPDVYALAAALKVKDSDLIVGKLTRFWAWASQHTQDGRLPGATFDLIDRVSHLKGFGRAMVSVGWLVEVTGGMEVPRFNRWMSRGAKARLGETKRKQMQRGSVPESSGQNPELVPKMSGQKRDYRTGQDRREESSLSLTPDPEPVAQPTERASEQPTSAARFLADRTERTGHAPPGFNAFVSEYPQGRALDRGGLLALWTAQGLESESASILGGLRAWKASEAFRDGFAPKARKFLEERHWESKPPEPKPVTAPRYGGGAF